MPNDPLAPILAGLPGEADYDAVHAALMATERGRRFLTEYADRNRHADTTMIVGAIAQLEAALRGEGAPRANAAGVLMEIAAVIDRIQAAIAPGTQPAPDVSVAIERLQDIAFVLHEREGETLAQAVAELAASLPTVSDAPSEPVEAAPPQQASTEVSLSEAVLNQAFADDFFASANFPDDTPACEQTASRQALGAVQPNEAVPSAQTVSTEPPPVPTLSAEAAAPAAADTIQSEQPSAEPPRVIPPPPARAIPRPPGSDPLAAVRDLSEEELIALFS